MMSNSSAFLISPSFILALVGLTKKSVPFSMYLARIYFI